MSNPLLRLPHPFGTFWAIMQWLGSHADRLWGWQQMQAFFKLEIDSTDYP